MSDREFGIDPVIVMGMHRSGTTMVARLLAEMAGHLGADQSMATSESLSFQRLNIQLLCDCNASWFNPAPMWEILNNDQHVERMADSLRSRLPAESATAFWGDDKSHDDRPATFWGWKDPRNTLTLPIWRHLFPDARIVYIVRNGIDVAGSLVKRDEQLYGFRSQFGTAIKKMLVRVMPQRWPAFQQRRLEDKPRPFTLEEAFQLWADYLRFAEFTTANVPDGRILRLRYEDLLCDPLDSLQKIDEFVAAGTAADAIAKLASGINRKRRFAFLPNAQLCDFYRDHCQHQQMVNNRYDRILDQGTDPTSG